MNTVFQWTPTALLGRKLEEPHPLKLPRIFKIIPVHFLARGEDRGSGKGVSCNASELNESHSRLLKLTEASQIGLIEYLCQRYRVLVVWTRFCITIILQL